MANSLRRLSPLPPAPGALSAVTEDYLKAIHKLSQRHCPVATMVLARELGLSPGAVSKMLKSLTARGLIEHQRHQGVALTPAGERIALKVIRHHRLLELYLVKVLGMPWDRVNAEADILEHALSASLEARLVAVLGDPTRDPHGDPIPRLDGTYDEHAGIRLADLPPGATARVLRVPDDDGALLCHLGALGVVPDASVTMLRREPFEGALHIGVAGISTEQIVSGYVAERITVAHEAEDQRIPSAQQ